MSCYVLGDIPIIITLSRLSAKLLVIHFVYALTKGGGGIYDRENTPFKVNDKN